MRQRRRECRCPATARSGNVIEQKQAVAMQQSRAANPRPEKQRRSKTAPPWPTGENCRAHADDARRTFKLARKTNGEERVNSMNNDLSIASGRTSPWTSGSSESKSFPAASDGAPTFFNTLWGEKEPGELRGGRRAVATLARSQYQRCHAPRPGEEEFPAMTDFSLSAGFIAARFAMKLLAVAYNRGWYANNFCPLSAFRVALT